MSRRIFLFRCTASMTGHGHPHTGVSFMSMCVLLMLLYTGLTQLWAFENSEGRHSHISDCRLPLSCAPCSLCLMLPKFNINYFTSTSVSPEIYMSFYPNLHSICTYTIYTVELYSNLLNVHFTLSFRGKISNIFFLSQ